MGKLMKKGASFLLVLSLVVVLSPTDVSAATSEPTARKSITMKVGTTKSVELQGKSITSKKFTSTKKSIATVNKSGKVKALKYGTTIIKTTVTYGTETKTLKTVVTVVKKSGFTAAKVYKKIKAMEEKYPEGMPWTNENMYEWHAVPGVIYQMYGCAGFASILSDAAFGKKTVAKEIQKPSAAKVRVGDVLRVNGDTHSVIVLKVEEDGFIIAEGNYNSSIHWGRKISKKSKINSMFTRYDA